MSNKGVIADISVSNTAGDLWEEVFSSTNCGNKMLFIDDKETYRVRFIGPFMQGRKLYIPPSANLKRKISQIEAKALVKGDSTVYEIVRKRVFEEAGRYTNANALPKRDGFKPKRKGWQVPETIKTLSAFPTVNPQSIKEREYFDALRAIDRLYNQTTWNNCLFSNVYIRECTKYANSISDGDPIYVISLNDFEITRMFKSIAEQYSSGKDLVMAKISGLLAHDFVFQKRKGTDSLEIFVTMSDKPTAMSNPEIAKIFKRNLLDIRQIALGYNKSFSKNLCGYIYKIQDEYRMSEQLMQELHRENDVLNEDAMIEEVEEHFNDLPEDALECNHGDSITYLEI